jgi:hypothetical protein
MFFPSLGQKFQVLAPSSLRLSFKHLEQNLGQYLADFLFCFQFPHRMTMIFDYLWPLPLSVYFSHCLDISESTHPYLSYFIRTSIRWVIILESGSPLFIVFLLCSVSLTSHVALYAFLLVSLPWASFPTVCHRPLQTQLSLWATPQHCCCRLNDLSFSPRSLRTEDLKLFFRHHSFLMLPKSAVEMLAPGTHSRNWGRAEACPTQHHPISKHTHTYAHTYTLIHTHILT